MRALGAILAGGKARRFGSDKAAALLNGKALIAHVADGLRGQVEALVVVGRPWPELSMLPDLPEGALGPLAGLNAALHHAAGLGLDGVISAGCDTLPVPPDLVVRLSGPEPAHVSGHYLLGWWPVGLAPLLDRHLADSADRSMRGWITLCGARAISMPGQLHNLNRPADLDAYARSIADD